MFTNYKNYNMEFVNKHAIAPNVEVPSVMGSKIYKRTNQVFGLGVDYTF
jgi:hypothetical protein